MYGPREYVIPKGVGGKCRTTTTANVKTITNSYFSTLRPSRFLAVKSMFVRSWQFNIGACTHKRGGLVRDRCMFRASFASPLIPLPDPPSSERVL